MGLGGDELCGNQGGDALGGIFVEGSVYTSLSLTQTFSSGLRRVRSGQRLGSRENSLAQTSVYSDALTTVLSSTIIRFKERE